MASSSQAHLCYYTSSKIILAHLFYHLQELASIVVAESRHVLRKLLDTKLNILRLESFSINFQWLAPESALGGGLLWEGLLLIPCVHFSSQSPATRWPCCPNGSTEPVLVR